MKFATGLVFALVGALFTWNRLERPARAPHADASGTVVGTNGENRRQSGFFGFFVWASAIAASLLAVSALLPAHLIQPVQDLLGWCLAGAVAALSLSAVIRALEGLLDA
jgi:hypothetical protein